MSKTYRQLISYIVENAAPTGIKIYHTDKEGQQSHTVVFTPRDAQSHEKEVKKSGGKVTHRALMFGTSEGEKVAVKEEVELDEDWGSYSKQTFKRKELEHELAGEERRARRDAEPHHVYINGKIWKKEGKPVEFKSARHANAAGVSIQKKDPSKDVRYAHHSLYAKNGGTLKEETDQLNEVSKETSRKEEAEQVDEAVKINSKVRIHAPGKDYHDQEGYVGEIRHGVHAKAPKTYTVDYGNGKSVQLDKKHIKLVKEEAELTLEELEMIEEMDVLSF